MLTNQSKQAGVSLIELMVGVAIALILLTGVITVVLRISTSGADSIQAARLNQQLRGTMDFLSKDLQRAGYFDWYDVWDNDDDSNPLTLGVLTDVNTDGTVGILDYYQATAPAFSRFGEVRLMRFPTPGTSTGAPVACTANCDCVLFSYDLNQDGMQGVGAASGSGTGQNDDNFEMFGFRWNGGAIEQRTALDNVSDWNTCSSAPANGWQDVTDENVTITNLAMSLGIGTSTAFDATVYVIDPDGTPAPVMATACTPSVAGTYPDGGDTLCLWRRKIDLVLEGQLSSDTGVNVELINSVKIKNDFLDTQP